MNTAKSVKPNKELERNDIPVEEQPLVERDEKIEMHQVTKAMKPGNFVTGIQGPGSCGAESSKTGSSKPGSFTYGSQVSKLVSANKCLDKKVGQKLEIDLKEGNQGDKIVTLIKKDTEISQEISYNTKDTNMSSRKVLEFGNQSSNDIDTVESDFLAVDNLDCLCRTDFSDKIAVTVQRLTTVQDLSTLSKSCSDSTFLWNLCKKSKGNKEKRNEIVCLIVSNNYIQAIERLLVAIDHQNVFTSLNSKSVIWQNIKQLASLAWLISDLNAEFCQEIMSSVSLTNLFLKFLKHFTVTDILCKDCVIFFIKFLLGCFHNCLRHVSATRKILRDSLLLQILQSVLKMFSSVAMVKVKSLIVLSYLVDESENSLLTADERDLLFLLDVLQDAVQSHDHLSKKYGMNVLELLQGLSNLIVNDDNKVKLVELGILKIYIGILKGNADMEEILLTVTGIWKLSFHQKNKEIIRQETDFLQVLYDINRYKNDEIHHAVRGVLWELQQQKTAKTPKVEAEVKCPHIMISYQWDSQTTMLRVKDGLKEYGYKVWMDVEHMTGSTLEAMSLAVEKSTVVLICMSQKYKDSPSCRSEAEYTYKLQKNFIPLRLESNYNPDGWLGMLIGTKLYFDFWEEDKFDSMLIKLVKELGNRGKISTYESQIDGGLADTHDYKVTLCQRSINYSCWTCDDVKSWIQSLQLTKGNDRLYCIDGQLLRELKSLQEKVPDFFYSVLKTEFQLDIISSLKFSRALRDI